ncbi:MAG: hypothetical protein AAF432_04960 [Planctomycetota bacterium]
MNKETAIYMWFVCTCLIVALSGLTKVREASAMLSAIDDASNATPFQMNRGAIFTENEAIAAALGDLVSYLIAAIQHGEIPSDLITENDQQRHAFFIATLQRLKARSDSAWISPLVLKSFSPDGDETFLITIAFMRAQDDRSQINKIIEFHAYPHNGSYRFRSPFDYRTRSLNIEDVVEVRYHVQSSIDRAHAEAFVEFKREFEARLGMQTTNLDYYCFETLDELLRAYGIVYDCGKCNWLKEDLGFMDNNGRAFITGTGNERFIFDYLVDYMSHFCDDDEDLYPPFVIGMAAYYGGYGLSGDDVETLKAQFRAELAARPDMDFLEEFRKGRQSSIERHFTYFVISAFLCEDVLERHDFDAVMRLARTGRSGERFFTMLEELLEIDESNFHAHIVELIRDDA